MNERNRQMVVELSKLTGEEFEKKYANDMVNDHRFAVEEFSKAANVARNEDYKKFFKKELPS